MGHYSVPYFGEEFFFFSSFAQFEQKAGRVDANLPAGVCSQSTPCVEESEQGIHPTTLCIPNHSQELQQVAAPLSLPPPTISHW